MKKLPQRGNLKAKLAKYYKKKHMHVHTFPKPAPILVTMNLSTPTPPPPPDPTPDLCPNTQTPSLHPLFSADAQQHWFHMQNKI